VSRVQAIAVLISGRTAMLSVGGVQVAGQARRAHGACEGSGHGGGAAGSVPCALRARLWTSIVGRRQPGSRPRVPIEEDVAVARVGLGKDESLR
jgi:hypothetical protein